MDIETLQPRRRAMSRKFIVSLAAIAMLASTALVSGAANAKAPHSNSNHGIYVHPHFNNHVRYWRFHEHYVRPVGYVRPVVAGSCTCLTKDYTPEGIVVFKDLCTKEMASAPVDGGPAKASEVEAPTNFAGKSYQDYLAANPQAQTAEKKN
jgi:hypothetical protein